MLVTWADRYMTVTDCCTSVSYSRYLWQALLVLVTWAERYYNHPALVNSNALGSLRLAMQIPHRRANVYGARSLACLSTNRNNFPRLRRENCVRPLLGLLTSMCAATRRYAARALCNLSKDPESACEMHRLEAISYIFKAKRLIDERTSDTCQSSLASPMQQMGPRVEGPSGPLQRLGRRASHSSSRDAPPGQLGEAAKAEDGRQDARPLSAASALRTPPKPTRPRSASGCATRSTLGDDDAEEDDGKRVLVRAHRHPHDRAPSQRVPRPWR